MALPVLPSPPRMDRSPAPIPSPVHSVGKLVVMSTVMPSSLHQPLTPGVSAGEPLPYPIWHPSLAPRGSTPPWSSQSKILEAESSCYSRSRKSCSRHGHHPSPASWHGQWQGPHCPFWTSWVYHQSQGYRSALVASVLGTLTTALAAALSSGLIATSNVVSIPASAAAPIPAPAPIPTPIPLLLALRDPRGAKGSDQTPSTLHFLILFIVG